MALRDDIVNEKVALNRIVQRSSLGKHINERILRPILDSLDSSLDAILEDLGFMIVSEIQYRLATAPSGNNYQVWQYDEEGDPKYTFLGWYTASAEAGGIPYSPGEATETGLPTGSLYQSFWYELEGDGTLKITIDSPQGTELDYYFKKEWGKIFLGVETSRGQALPVGEYFKILNESTRPDFLNNILERKRKYWNSWLQTKFGQAVKQVTRRWTVTRALKINIYWESST